MLENLGALEALKDVGVLGEGLEGVFEGLLPGVLGLVGADDDAAGAPGEFGEAAGFEDEIALRLGEGGELAEVLDVEAWDDGVGWEGLRVEDPGVGDDLLEGAQMAIGEGASPEVAQGAHPEEGEPEFFFELRFPGGGDVEVSEEGFLLELVGAGDVGEVK